MSVLRCACVVFIAVPLLLVKPGIAAAQDREDIAVEQLTPLKTGVSELVEASGGKKAAPYRQLEVSMSEGIKYVPGKNHTGVCSGDDGDDIYNSYVYQHDKHGRPVRKIAYSAGPNNTKPTSDEFINNYIDYTYDKQGRFLKDRSFSGRGPDNKWFTADDAENYHSVYEYDRLGRKTRVVRYAPDGATLDYTAFVIDQSGSIVKDVVYKAKGPDAAWFTADDEIDKYHLFEYDGHGLLLRAKECLGKANGKGPDGTWFTADDVVSSTKEFIYNAKGKLTEIKKYIGAGADGVWFTGDDIIQYYTLYKYEK